MDLRKFVAPEIVFGAGARKLAGQYAANLGARRALLVTDPGVAAAGWAQEVAHSLDQAGVEHVLFSQVSPNPRDTEVMAGAEVYVQAGCNAIVAVGGGSPMDCAKGIGIVTTSGGHIRDYEGVDEVPVPCPPLIFVPTTAGTAADVSQFAIVTHTDELYKMAVVSKAVVPDVSLTDPICTTSMSAELTAFTGLDALTHAVEALASNASSPITDLHAIEAVRLIHRHLEATLAQPDDLEHRTGMMLASMQAGLAFSNASLGAVHAMAHSLGGYKDLPHGECNAILLPWVVEYNWHSAPRAFRTLGSCLGMDGASKEAVVGELRRLQQAVGVHRTLSRMGVETQDLARLTRHAEADACMVTNPRCPEPGEIEAIYGQAL